MVWTASCTKHYQEHTLVGASYFFEVIGRRTARVGTKQPVMNGWLAGRYTPCSNKKVWHQHNVQQCNISIYMIITWKTTQNYCNLPNYTQNSNWNFVVNSTAMKFKISDVYLIFDQKCIPSTSMLQHGCFCHFVKY